MSRAPRPAASRPTDGGPWGEQMEFNLDVAGYCTITSLRPMRDADARSTWGGADASGRARCGQSPGNRRARPPPMAYGVKPVSRQR